MGGRIVRGWARIRLLRTGDLLRLVGCLEIGRLHLEQEQGLDGAAPATAPQLLQEGEEGAQLLVEQEPVLFSRVVELQVPAPSWRADAA